MCRFKSGIILKNKIVIAPEDNESHSDLLESLGIKDDYIGASKTFVRAELVPKKMMSGGLIRQKNRRNGCLSLIKI